MRIFVSLIIGLICFSPSLWSANQWPTWRGPNADGTVTDCQPPTQWSATQNIKWKVKLPGTGSSTPIIWNEKLFLLLAESTDKQATPEAIAKTRVKIEGAPPLPTVSNPEPTIIHRFDVLCMDRTNGKTIWRRTAREELPHEGHHRDHGYASSSPVTDGEHLFINYGSRGIHCYTLEGKPVWNRDLGKMTTRRHYGEGSSPALHGDTLIVNWDHEGESFIVALAKRTGKELWRQPRDEVTSWATPIVVEHNGIPQVVVSGTQRVRGYGLKNGEILWEVAGLPGNVVATPVAADGFVYAAGSYKKQTLLAIRLGGATGDITGTDHIAWSKTRSTPYVPSPILLNGWLYYLRHYQGILSRANAKTGSEPGGPFRLGPIFTVYSSPVAVKGRIYITDRNGKTIVISDGQEPSALALNELSDQFSASPAIFGENLVLRGEKFIYCLSDNLKKTKNN